MPITTASAPSHASSTVDRTNTSGSLGSSETAGSYALTEIPPRISRRASLIAGDSRVSGVPALNARPSRPTLPFLGSARAMFRAKPRTWRAFCSMAAPRTTKSYPSPSAIARSALASFGRHEPPQPRPGRR